MTYATVSPAQRQGRSRQCYCFNRRASSSCTTGSFASPARSPASSAAGCAAQMLCYARGMWLCPLPTGEALRKLAERCGISSAVEASDHEIQRRIREVQRYNREQWLFWASMAAPFVAVGSLWAVIHNGQQQAENARAQAEN